MRSESGVRKDTNMFRSIDAVDKHGVVSNFRLSDFHFLGSSCGIKPVKEKNKEKKEKGPTTTRVSARQNGLSANMNICKYTNNVPRYFSSLGHQLSSKRHPQQ